MVRVGVEEEAELLRMALAEALSRPHKTLQYWLVGGGGGAGPEGATPTWSLWIHHRQGTCSLSSPPLPSSCTP